MNKAHFTNFYTIEQLELGREIAEKLNDETSLEQFLRYTALLPHTYLREALRKALDAPEHLITKSRAAIFVGKVNAHLKFGNGRSGY